MNHHTSSNRARRATALVLVAGIASIAVLAAAPTAAAAECRVFNDAGVQILECKTPRGVCAAGSGEYNGASFSGCLAVDY